MSTPPVADDSAPERAISGQSPSLESPFVRPPPAGPSALVAAGAPFTTSTSSLQPSQDDAVLEAPAPISTGSALFRDASDEGEGSDTSVVRTLQHNGAPIASTSRSPMRDGGLTPKRIRASSAGSSDLSSMSSESSEGDDEALATGPGYSVERHPSSSNGPHLIRVNRTDALEEKWPPLGPFTDSKGAACEWRTDDKLRQRWMSQLGKQLAERLGLQQHPKEEWRLKDFPAGYRLFVHVKGERTDAYLYGSVRVTKFRTVNEYLPHIQMLCENNSQPCACKYCSGTKLQGQVNNQLGITDIRIPISREKAEKREKKKARRAARENRQGMAEPGRRPGRGRRSDGLAAAKRPRSKKPYDGAYVDKDRDRDLSELGCIFRQGEMVWCQLETPIAGGWAEDLVIDYWPALCESRELVVKSRTVGEAGSSKEAPTRPGDIIVNGQFRPDAPVQLEVKQEYRWQLRLLGIGDPLLRSESQMLPWLEYPPTEALFDIPLRRGPLTQSWGGDSPDRIALKELVDLPSAITPFALALQIAAHVVSYWNLYDRYELPSLKVLQEAGWVFTEDEKADLKEDISQAWFQVLWWGAEKIWSGEMVRLVVGKADLPDDLRRPSPGSEERCFFLKITGIYRGKDDRPAIKGPVFELAPLVDGAVPPDEADYRAKLDKRVARYIPEPPPGFYFRCLSPPNTERHLVLEHIAGRYYPPSQLRMGASDPPVPNDTASSLAVQLRSRSLCGLTNGGRLVMKCACTQFQISQACQLMLPVIDIFRAQNWISTRKLALKTSEKVAEGEMESHFRDEEASRAGQVAGNMDTAATTSGVTAGV